MTQLPKKMFSLFTISINYIFSILVYKNGLNYNKEFILNYLSIHHIKHKLNSWK